MRRQLKLLLIYIALIPFYQKSEACACEDYNLTIDSLSQLKEYEFIALVKIIDDQDDVRPARSTPETFGILSFEILELFKGKEISTVLEYSKYSSCDLGISKGQEWVLFGRKFKGKFYIDACDRNKRYRRTDQLRDWQYKRGFEELEQLRKLYQHPIHLFLNEKRKEFYDSGKIEIEENYVDGKLNGERKIWYPSGVLFCHQYYINDTLDGKSEWFYPTGQIYDEGYYLKGQHCNVSRIYFDSTLDLSWKSYLIDNYYKTEDSLNFAYNRVQPEYEITFDSFGRAVTSKVYSRVGKIKKEQTIDPDKKFRTIIFYHDNGNVSSIGYSSNEKNYGHYQEYSENGFPENGWDYDENGKPIKSTLK